MEKLPRVYLCCLIIILNGFLTLAERALSCSECVRTPTACRRISGLYTVTVLSQGTYNPVVEIPSPACNINLTEFSRSKNYIALKTKRGQGIINSYWGLGQPGQYYGAGARFTYDRQSTSCRGSCIQSEGPTSENVVVQILYYDKNPGISYEFTLPNHVAFTPLEGTYSKQRATHPAKSSSLSSSVSSSSSSSTSALTSSRRRAHRGSRHHTRRYRQRHQERGAGQGEYYSGSQYSRNEGRPEGTEALAARPDPAVRTSGGSRRTRQHDYTGQRYGTHTLAGKGLSYTAQTDTDRERLPRRQDRRVIGRYRPRQVTKLAPPTYVSGSSRQTLYSRQPRYQGLSASGTDYNRRQNTVAQSSFAGRSRGHTSSKDTFRWKISGFTECSKTCGGGVQKTNIVCVSSNDGTQVVVTPEDCVHSRKPRERVVECNTSPCEPAWESDEWSDCSVTCGSGTQTRTVECRQRLSPSLTLRVSADQCGLTDKPAVAQQCEKGFCAQWKAGAWGQCSSDCGGGDKTRSVICVDQFESQIPGNYCTGAMPAQTKRCNKHKCSNSWWLSPWDSQCSSSCGQGHLRRSAVCLNERDRVLPDSYCVESERPRLSKTCRSDATCSSAWFAGPWGKCSSSCGDGVRTRRVACLRMGADTLQVVTDAECDDLVQPSTEEECHNSDCKAKWYTNEWSECSVSCGEGFRSREVRCVEEQRSSTRCEASVRPSGKEVCQKSPCISFQRIDRYVPRRRERQELTLSQDLRTSQALNDPRCRDHLSHCLYVLQSRLCSYPYYQDKCCRTCSKKR